MPDCRYCDETFTEEEAYLEHLQEAHADELGPIDRRRIEGGEDEGIDLPTGPIAIALVIGVSAAIVAYAVLSPGGGGSAAAPGDVARTPTGIGSVHYHGTVEMTVAGETVDFTAPEYKRPRDNPAFHFEGQNDPRWHVHARGVTLEYAMATLGIEVSADSVTFEGTTYAEGEGATVIVEVDGEAVEPATYVLQEGDHVRIVARP